MKTSQNRRICKYRFLQATAVNFHQASMRTCISLQLFQICFYQSTGRVAGMSNLLVVFFVFHWSTMIVAGMGFPLVADHGFVVVVIVVVVTLQLLKEFSTTVLSE